MLNQVKTLLLLGVLSVGLVALGAAVGPGAAVAAGAVALALNVGAFFYSDRVILRMHGAREASAAEAPRLHAMVQELAARAGLPTPRVFLMDDPQPNAFATGRSPEKGVVAFTEGILRLLPERELRGVVAHELAHIANRDMLLSTIAAVIATAVTWVANLAQLSAFFGSQEDEEGGASPLGALALAIVAPIAATLVQLGISRSREYLADATGARICGDPESLALALERMESAAGRVSAAAPQPATASLFIVNPLAGGGLLRLFSTHPPIDERARRLRALAARPELGARVEARALGA
jgi:heat shock protein HtpX